MDISIQNIKSYVFDLKTESLRIKRANELLSSNITITEKVDGTKLTLVRTTASDADYTKNWIVSYKGQILNAKEFAHISDKEKQNITKISIGRSQYAIIFDHLKSINSRAGSIPSNTEFSIEFAQNKDTLTRTYERLGGMFLRSYGTVNYRIVANKLYTEVIGEEITDYASVKKMADTLQIATFPIMFSGKITQENINEYPAIASKMIGVDWKNPIDVLKKFESAILSIESTLGGKTEGVVLKLDDGRFFKFVQADQYDTKSGARAEKQAALKIDPEAKTPYFKLIRDLIYKIMKEVGTEGKTEEDVISDINFYIVKNEAKLENFFEKLSKVSGGKRTVMGMRDDIHDTIITILSNESLLTQNKKTVALIPMGAKPFHKGHFELIELAAKECDNVIVFGSLADRKVEGEFPIDGKAYLKFWHDMFIPILPKNVKFKFSESPISSVYMQLRWFEQSYVQDEIAPPTVRIYSDPEDLKLNWKDEVFMDPKKAGCPTLFNAGKIERNEVARGSKTTDISGTKMRKFLETGDKESFLKNLPPVTDEQKEEIWSTLIQKRAEKKEDTPKKMKEENLYKFFINEIIDSVYNEMFNEGGWRNVATQDWEVKPPVVAGLVYLMDRFLNEFNQWSGLPELKHNGPAGSGTYYKDDLKDNPDAVYGDVDMMMVLPVDTNDRPTQLESNKLYGDKIREFIDTRRPNYIHADLGDESFGFEYLIFNVSIDDVQAALKKLNMPPDDIKKISSNLPSDAPFKVQVDMMKTYTVSAEWTKIRATPQRGLKGFVTGKLLSTLSDALQITIGTSTNPYINTVDGKIVSTAVKKNAVPVFFNPNEVFLEVLKYYGNLAGVQNVDPSPLAGHYGLNEQDPSLKKKMETVVALANAFEKNGIFDAGVIVSKSKTKFTSRDQFIKYVLDTFIEKMEDSKMAPKLDKAQTPAAFRTVDKIKQHADIGINTAKEIIKEGPYILSEAEGKSIAAIDANTIKTVNGQPAAATTKLKIVGPDGKDVKNKVSSDVKELVHALNGNIGFWKKDNPYIENGFVFNGSSQYLMSGDEKYKELAKYKSSFGDIDVIVPKSKLPSLKSFLDGIDDNKVEWTPTSANKITNAFHYVGNPKGQSIPDQMVTLWYYTPTNQVVQVDFEGDDMFIDPQGYEKPSEWIKFSKDSPWEDLVVGIKGLAGALMLRSLARAATVLPNAVVLTPGGYKKVMAGTVKELTDKEVTKAAQHSVPSAYTLNTGGGGTGIRKAYEFVKTMPYNGKMVDAYKFVEAKETKPEDRIIDVSEIFKILFKKAPSAEEKASFRSYRGLLNLAKKYMDRNTINLAMSRFSEILSKENLKPEDVDAIRNASKEILGISI